MAASSRQSHSCEYTRRGLDLDTYYDRHIAEPEDMSNIRQAMKSAKGPGNFRNLFMYSPNGKKDDIQIIPRSEVAAKGEFLNIKNVSRDDMMAAHRVPPQMMGIMPNNVGGSGDVEKAANVFVRNELIPLQKKLEELNIWIEEKIITFRSYSLEQ